MNVHVVLFCGIPRNEIWKQSIYLLYDNLLQLQQPAEISFHSTVRNAMQL